MFASTKEGRAVRAGDSGAMNWGRRKAAPADRGVKVLGYREEAWLFILCMQSLEIPGPYDVIRLGCIFCGAFGATMRLFSSRYAPGVVSA